MTQFSKDELKSLIAQAHADEEFAVDPDKTDFNGNEYVTHMVRLSMAVSLLVIADNLTAMRFDGNSNELPRIGDNVNTIADEMFNLRNLLDTRLP